MAEGPMQLCPAQGRCAGCDPGQLEMGTQMGCYGDGIVGGAGPGVAAVGTELEMSVSWHQ